jgi:hypothetical protein
MPLGALGAISAEGTKRFLDALSGGRTMDGVNTLGSNASVTRGVCHALSTVTLHVGRALVTTVVWQQEGNTAQWQTSRTKKQRCKNAKSSLCLIKHHILKMDASRQIHAPAALPPVPIEYESGWATETVRTLWTREEYLALAGNQTPIPRSSCP